jgi:hypothetical protein
VALGGLVGRTGGSRGGAGGSQGFTGGARGTRVEILVGYLHGRGVC